MLRPWIARSVATFVSAMPCICAPTIPWPLRPELQIRPRNADIEQDDRRGIENREGGGRDSICLAPSTSTAKRRIVPDICARGLADGG
jgi:hypothetical protein